MLFRFRNQTLFRNGMLFNRDYDESCIGGGIGICNS